MWREVPNRVPGTRLAVAVLVSLAAPAAAEVRGVVRVGVLPLELVSSESTPLFGEEIHDAMTAYNVAAIAYDQLHGRRHGTTRTIDADDLGVRDTLVTVAPALEVGIEHVYLRIEPVVGVGDELRTVGLGLYPINVAVPLAGGDVIPYLSAGGLAGWLDREGDGDVGALVLARVAAGVRFADRVAIEVGYGAFVLGGVIDTDRLARLTDYDPRGDAPPPPADEAVEAGEQRDLVDVSLGVTF